MPRDRQLSVREMKRVLKPGGQAYLSLGFPPPLGFVDSAEWEATLEGFTINRRGGTIEKWAVVCKKSE